MSKNIDVDVTQALAGLSKLNNEYSAWVNRALSQMADALLLLSSNEVPFDESTLSKSGHVFTDGDFQTGVAYGGVSAPYALYQHEGVRADGTHRIRNYQNGRKGKYLEDPVKMNLTKWQTIFTTEIAKHL